MAANLTDLINGLVEQLITPGASCNTHQPFITLGSGTAPSINYNVPQKTGFTVTGLVTLIDDENAFFQHF